MTEMQTYIDRKHDCAVRVTVFEWLAAKVQLYGDVLPRKILEDGLQYNNKRIPLVGPQGIFKPRLLNDIPLSITTAPKGLYDDSFGPDNLLRYRYRGTDSGHRDNVGLRAAMVYRVPLVYFHGIIPGKYLAVWPVFIVGDDTTNLTFTVAVDEESKTMSELARIRNGIPVLQAAEARDESRRAYITAAVRQRLHQRGFRERVLDAYREQCALCRLRHAELLEAAHIIPDPAPGGEPVVQNGISLCTFHHVAFDKMFLGITPDCKVRIREDILKEEDGPMLRYALQGLHNSRIYLPRKPELRPDPERLLQRYREFNEFRAVA